MITLCLPCPTRTLINVTGNLSCIECTAEKVKGPVLDSPWGKHFSQAHLPRPCGGSFTLHLRARGHQRQSFENGSQWRHSISLQSNYRGLKDVSKSATQKIYARPYFIFLLLLCFVVFFFTFKEWVWGFLVNLPEFRLHKALCLQKYKYQHDNSEVQKWVPPLLEASLAHTAPLLQPLSTLHSFLPTVLRSPFSL